MAFGQPLFKGETFLGNLRKVDALKEIAASRNMSIAQLALSWVISGPVVSVGLVGARTPAEIEENVKAVDWIMIESEREELRAVITG